MARAKRTERAEARRRYRATLATDPLAERRGRRRRAQPPAPARRQAVRTPRQPASRPRAYHPSGSASCDAFRQSIRPVHVREDIAALPWITIHTKAIWLPVLITDRRHDRHRGDRRERHGDRPAVHLFRRLPGHRRGLHRRLPRPASELARRRRHRPRVGRLLCGAGRERPAAAAVRRAVRGQCAGASVSAFIYSPIMGAFFAAAAAWYRRFLALSSPNRNRPPGRRRPRSSGPATAERAAGTSQKAPAKR